MTIIVTQEEKMKKAKSSTTSIVTIDIGKKKKFFKRNSNNFHKMKKYGKPPQHASVNILNEPKKEDFKKKYNFCHLFGYKKVDCIKFETWLDKKGMCSLLVCFESNLVDVSFDT